jgi:hypothetical protein
MTTRSPVHVRLILFIEEMKTMSIDFDEAYEVWMHSLIEKETNPRVLSRIEKGN